jgi:hypothetical protein
VAVVGSSASNNEAMFERAVLAAGGLRVFDLLPRNTNLGKNADFVFRNENVIAELKCLVHDPRDAEWFRISMNEKFRRWVTEGRIPPFWGTFTVNIRDLPENCAIEAVSLLKKHFVKLVSDANKQIKNTKRILGMPAARGLLVFLQSGDYFLPPNTILNLVNRCLPDQHNRSVDDVIHANADLAAIQPGNGDRHAFFLHACRDVQNPISLDLVDRLQQCWQTELEQRIGGLFRRADWVGPRELDTMVYSREPSARPVFRQAR